MTGLSKLIWNHVTILFTLGALISSCDTTSADENLRFVVHHHEITRQPWDDIELDTGGIEFCSRIMNQRRREIWEQRQAQSSERHSQTAHAESTPRIYMVEDRVEVCGYPDERALSGLAFYECD